MSARASSGVPLVTVITVNFDGERYLPDLLEALQHQTYPHFEVLVIDNASTDRSVALVERYFPWVRIVRSRENLGFAGGNNLGIREAKGELFALINNDTWPAPDWLTHLVEAARGSSRIAGVGSKILFARPFLPVRLEVPTFTPALTRLSSDTRAVGVFLSDRSGFEGCSYRKKVFKSGFFGDEVLGGEKGRWTSGQATVFLPVESLEEPQSLGLRVLGGKAPIPRPLTVSIGGTTVGELPIGPDWSSHRVEVTADLARREGFDVLNNAASFLKPDGAAGDRGIFEPDRGQYDDPEDVEALCGAAMLLAREAVEEVGAFDRDFFMYFEDTELSWRLRKRGFRLRYEPKSVVRHFHASTSVEWSPLFNFLVGRNRILMLIKHASAPVIIRAYAQELYRLLHLLRIHRSIRHVDVRTRLKVQLSLLVKGPRALAKRFGLLEH